MTFGGWSIFCIVILTVLILDLFVFHRKAHVICFKEALLGSLAWIALAMLFNLYIYFAMGKLAAVNFFTGYLVEKSLSVDNIFVFLMIFHYFKTPATSLHKVLFWGIFGAIVSRAIFILLGLAVIEKFHPIIYLFGIFLIITGFKLAFMKGKEIHPERNFVIKLIHRFFPVTKEYEDDRFFVKRNTKLFMTPLFLVLIAIETTDLVFAVDSIPAILAITLDPFIVFTSNIFAILGLRSLFFLVAGSLSLFHYLHYGIALILVFVGFKMLISDVWKISSFLTLGITGAILAVSILASIWKAKKT